MLTEFSVNGINCFKDLRLKLKSNNTYDFNIDAINNGVIKDSIIYGNAGSGRTNLGYVLLDITQS